jgi:hypothetical protein
LYSTGILQYIYILTRLECCKCLIGLLVLEHLASSLCWLSTLPSVVHKKMNIPVAEIIFFLSEIKPIKFLAYGVSTDVKINYFKSKIVLELPEKNAYELNAAILKILKYYLTLCVSLDLKTSISKKAA